MRKESIHPKTLAGMAALLAYIAACEVPPTLAEMAAHLGYSQSGVANWLRKLVAAGRVTIVPGVSRGVRIVKEAGER